MTDWGIVATLAAPTVTAFAYVAYMHPDAYFKLARTIFDILLILFVAFMSWNMAIYKAAALIENGQELVAKVGLPNWMFIGLFSAFGLHLLFFLLPLLGITAKERGGGTDKPE